MIFNKIVRLLPFGKVPEVDGVTLQQSLNAPAAGPFLVDVRTRMEWQEYHIDGAVNIPVTGLSKRLSELPQNKETEIIAICLSAHRSIPAVRILQDAGFKKARQLKGGMMAWKKAGLPIVGNK